MKKNSKNFHLMRLRAFPHRIKLFHRHKLFLVQREILCNRVKTPTDSPTSGWQTFKWIMITHCLCHCEGIFERDRAIEMNGMESDPPKIEWSVNASGRASDSSNENHVMEIFLTLLSWLFIIFCSSLRMMLNFIIESELKMERPKARPG